MGISAPYRPSPYPAKGPYDLTVLGLQILVCPGEAGEALKAPVNALGV